MKVEVAESAGFCFGVKRAVDKVYELTEAGGKIYTYGPIIHNEEVVEDLISRGVGVINSPDDAACEGGGKVVIRSHGVSRKVMEQLRGRGMEIIDATCPFVAKIHQTVREASEKGDHVIVIGDPDHPEVLGITGWVDGPCSVVKDESEIRTLDIPEGVPVCVVAQTTFNFEKFNFLVEELGKLFYIEKAVNTICNATRKRQSEARELAARADAMIVIGGKNSSNTQKLYEICSRECCRTYYIQTVRDLHTEDLPFGGVVGITAGASTPIYLIEEVRNLCLS